MDLEPKDDTERLYLVAVLAVLRNQQYTGVIPKLNAALREAAKISAEKFDWIKRNQAARQTAGEMFRAGRTPDDIAAKIGVPVEEVRHFLSWLRMEDVIKAPNR